MHKKIIELSDKRINFFLENLGTCSWYKWHKTFLEAVKWELKEVEEELKEKNSVYLEDELWDVFWTYVCFLQSLKAEGKITSLERVFERSYKKFSERISVKTWENNSDWDEVKKKQKEEIKNEHNNLYNN